MIHFLDIPKSHIQNGWQQVRKSSNIGFFWCSLQYHISFILKKKNSFNMHIMMEKYHPSKQNGHS